MITYWLNGECEDVHNTQQQTENIKEASVQTMVTFNVSDHDQELDPGHLDDGLNNKFGDYHLADIVNK